MISMNELNVVTERLRPTRDIEGEIFKVDVRPELAYSPHSKPCIEQIPLRTYVFRKSEDERDWILISWPNAAH